MFERATRLCRMSPQIATSRPSEPALAAADGQRVEQRLGRMLVAAVAGVDDRAVDLLGEQLTAPEFGMAHHQHVGMHGVEGHRRVDQRLALLDRAGRRRMLMTSAPSRLPASSNEVRVRVEFSKKQVDERAAAQQVALLVGAAVQVDIGVGEIEEGGDLLPGESFDAQQMAVAISKGGGSAHRRRLIVAASGEGKPQGCNGEIAR